ncbi:hypothetical protein KFE26_23065, partial [Shewanella sp. M16]|uniref:hypothetical protein n=1 Tax=Shewanella sp. M16 TaxID=2830837 RepID=UPI001BAF129E
GIKCFKYFKYFKYLILNFTPHWGYNGFVVGNSPRPKKGLLIMTLIELIESVKIDVKYAREHLQNARTREEANQRGAWLAQCKDRLASLEAKLSEKGA